MRTVATLGCLELLPLLPENVTPPGEWHGYGHEAAGRHDAALTERACAGREDG